MEATVKHSEIGIDCLLLRLSDRGTMAKCYCYLVLGVEAVQWRTRSEMKPARPHERGA
jgi:hypothetical protein